MEKKRSKKSGLAKYSTFSEIVFLLSTVGFLIVLSLLGILPLKYMLIIVGVLAVLNVLFGSIAFLKGVNNFNKVIQSVLCTLLSIALIVSSIGIEVYKDKIKSMFTDTENVTLYVYVLNDSPIENVDDLGNTSMGFSAFTNSDVQQRATDDLMGYLNKYELGEVKTTTYNGISSIIDALYSHEVDSIMIQDNLVDLIQEIKEYADFEEKVRVVYESTHQVTIKGSDSNFKIKNITKDPFIVAVGGRDSNGHFDVNIVLTVNPLTKQVLIVTIPRDAYSPLDGDPDKMDKLSYTGKLGVNTWLTTLQLYYDYNFNFYGIVDFYSIVDVINAIGGIDIYNPYTFSTNIGYYGPAYYYFPEGDLHLDGLNTLAYARERKSIGGDIERNKHESIVLKAIIKKLLSASVINNIDDVLSALEGKIATDFTPEIIYKLVNMQLKDNAEWNIKTYTITADLFYTYSYMIGHEYGPNYAMMDIHEDSLAEANNMIKRVLDGEVLE